MACKGICSKYQAIKPCRKGEGGNANGNSRYAMGQKRCQICDLFIKFEGVLCPCCNSKLRSRPRGYCFSTRARDNITLINYSLIAHSIIIVSTTAYLFVYDLDSLPKSIARYFYAVSLERARVVIVSLLMLNRKVLSSSSSSPQSSMYTIDQTPESIDAISENLSRFLVKTAKSYEDKVVNHGDESIIYEIYSKALSSFLK